MIGGYEGNRTPTFPLCILLNLLTVRSVDTNTILEPTIDIDRAVYDIGNLYGNAGGTFKEIELSIGPIPANLRSELKSLIFYLEY